MRRLPPAPRASFLRPGARELKDDQSDAVVFVAEYEAAGKMRYSAIGFHGKADKPDFNFYYLSEAQRDRKVSDFFAGRRARAEMMAGRKAARAEYVHPYKVGDVFSASWGYDQTNVDFYEVVEVPGPKSVAIRPIKARSEVNGHDTGLCWPLPGKYANDKPPMVKKVSPGGGLRMSSYSMAFPLGFKLVDGAKVYEGRRWSSYA